MSQQITVRYFAKFRDLAGRAEESVETKSATAAELFDELAERWTLAEPRHHCKVAVNDELVDWSCPIKHGDSVLLFPPVAGG